MEKLQIATKALFSIALIYLASVLLMMVLEVRQTREAIPDILRQVEQIEMDSDISEILKQVAQITDEISPIVKEVSAIREEIPAILHEVKETRATVPAVLQEVAAVRKEAPELLDKTQKLMTDAPQISARAGQGAAEGAVKGLITAPVDLIEGGVKNITKPRKKED